MCACHIGQVESYDRQEVRQRNEFLNIAINIAKTEFDSIKENLLKKDVSFIIIYDNKFPIRLFATTTVTRIVMMKKSNYAKFLLMKQKRPFSL